MTDTINQLTETEMETKLINMGFIITDESGCTDSVEVIELALSIGYSAILQTNETYIFVDA